MIRDTMFAPSFDNRPAYLVGRDALVERLAEGLSAEPGSRDRAVVMLGQRGYGKTVLLWELADRAAAMGYVVAHPTIVSSGMLDRIVEKVQQDGRRHLGGQERSACERVNWRVWVLRWIRVHTRGSRRQVFSVQAHPVG